MSQCGLCSCSCGCCSEEACLVIQRFVTSNSLSSSWSYQTRLTFALCWYLLVAFCVFWPIDSFSVIWLFHCIFSWLIAFTFLIIALSVACVFNVFGLTQFTTSRSRSALLPSTISRSHLAVEGDRSSFPEVTQKIVPAKLNLARALLDAVSYNGIGRSITSVQARLQPRLCSLH